MAEKTMHHAVIGADTFELVDQSARADVSDLKNALIKDTVLFNTADFEVGSITGSGVNDNSVSYRVRSADYFYADTDTWVIAPGSGFMAWVHIYNPDKTYYGNVYSLKNAYVPAGYYWRILIARAITEDTSETANVSTFISGFSYTTPKYLVQNEIGLLNDSVSGIDSKSKTSSETGFAGAYVETNGKIAYNKNASLYLGSYTKILNGAYKVDVTAGGLASILNVISFYDANLGYISGVPGSNGTSSYSNITIPDNAVYYLLSGFNTATLSAKFYTYERLDDIEAELESIPDLSLQYRYADVFTDKTVYQNTNIDYTTGTADSNNSFAATGFIEVEPETTYYVFRNDNKYHSVGNLAFYNNNKTYISGQQSTYASFTTPVGCYFVRFSVYYGTYTSSTFAFANMRITKGKIAPIEAIPYTTGFRTLGNLYGKKWVGLGDSLTEVNERAELHYFDYICAEQGTSFANFAVGGSGYMNRQNQNKAFYQLAEDIDTDGDIITIMGGVNDCLFAGNIGTATDSGTSTVCGCINETIDVIETLYPLHAPLGIISPLPCDWTDPNSESSYDSQLPSDATCRMSQLVEQLEIICKLRGYPFLDLFHSSGLKPDEASVKAEYYSCGGTPAGDGLHPNSKGQKIFYPRVMEFIKGICR